MYFNLNNQVNDLNEQMSECLDDIALDLSKLNVIGTEKVNVPSNKTKNDIDIDKWINLINDNCVDYNTKEKIVAKLMYVYQYGEVIAKEQIIYGTVKNNDTSYTFSLDNTNGFKCTSLFEVGKGIYKSEAIDINKHNDFSHIITITNNESNKVANNRYSCHNTKSFIIDIASKEIQYESNKTSKNKYQVNDNNDINILDIYDNYVETKDKWRCPHNNGIVLGKYKIENYDLMDNVITEENSFIARNTCPSKKTLDIDTHNYKISDGEFSSLMSGAIDARDKMVEVETIYHFGNIKELKKV